MFDFLLKLRLPFDPRQSLTKCRSAVAVLGLFFWAQLCEGFSNRRKVEHRVVAKSARTLQPIKYVAFRHTAKRSYSLAIPCSGDHAHKATRALFPRNPFQ